MKDRPANQERVPPVGAHQPRGTALATSRARTLARVLLVTVSTFVALVIGELAVRRLTPPSPLVRFEQLDERLQGDARYQFMNLIENDPDVFWKLRPNVTLPEDSRPFFGLISNSQGLREDHELEDKAAGEIRILFLGDSCTFGYGVGETETLAALTERRLQELFPAATIDCVNAGVPGYTLFQGWQFLQTRGFDLEPDLVILNFGWNDADGWDGQSDRQHYRALQASQPITPLRWSRLCQLIAQATARQESNPAGARLQIRLSPPDFVSLIETVDLETRARGIDLLLLVGASRQSVQDGASRGSEVELEPHQQAMLDFGRQMRFGPYEVSGHIDSVAVLSRVLGEHSLDELFVDGVHPTGLANQEIARSVAHKVEPWLTARLAGN